MHHRILLTAAVFSVAAVTLAEGEANAQTVSGPTVAANPNSPFPSRIVNGQNIGVSTRPAGQNPDGVNYSDCVSDMTLDYSVELSGFQGQTLQVWASTGDDCSVDSSRGVQGVAGCWLVYNAGAINQLATAPVDVFVRVQDLVAFQQAVPNPPVLVHEGVSACNAQPTSSSVPLTLYFVPLSGPNIATGATAYNQQIITDLVGPPQPTGVSIADGDTLFVVNWNANIDADTYGYDVFIDPIPGSAAAASAVMTGTGGMSTLVCPGTSSTPAAIGTSTSSTDTGTDTAMSSSASSVTSTLSASTMTSSSSVTTALAAASSSTTASLNEPSCFFENVGATGPLPGSTSCNSTLLQTETVIDAGLSEPVETFDDAGNLIEGGTVAAEGVVGTSLIPCDNLLGVSSSNCPAGQPAYTGTNLTITGESNAHYTIKGLTDGVTYNVVVAAVDASGNVGPQSTEACDYPAPVNDFWTIYRNGGGQAGGGFCGMGAGAKLQASTGAPVGSTLAIGGVAVVALAVGRRRRRRKTK